MLPLDYPDRIQIAFDDHRLVANAGLLLPVTLAQHLGLRELVDNHVDLGDAPGRANAGDKMLTLVASALDDDDIPTTLPVQVDLASAVEGGLSRHYCPRMSHCRENPGNRTCRAWKEARKSVRVLHREARRIAKDVTDLDGVTGGCIATVYQFTDGSVAYFALDAPAWREADEIAGRALLAIKPLTTVFST